MKTETWVVDHNSTTTYNKNLIKKHKSILNVSHFMYGKITSTLFKTIYICKYVGRRCISKRQCGLMKENGEGQLGVRMTISDKGEKRGI